MPFLSIIIPAYNSQETIIPLLESIRKSKKADFSEIEVIIVDDKSADETVGVITNFVRDLDRSALVGLRLNESSNASVLPSRLRRDSGYAPYQTVRGLVKTSFRAIPPRAFKTRFNLVRHLVRVIRLKKNSGPAQARNVGVKYAKGKVVLFLDADVLLYSNTLFEIVRSFKKDVDLYALTGVWDKKQKSNKFFPKFKALRDWSYWINERDPKNYYYLFSTRIAAIRRDLFLRLGGFDTTYKAALVEDIELTYRIARRYAVVFNPKVIVHHEFEDFLPIAKKYFWRSFYWSKIYRARKKFDPVATTSKEALTTISAGGIVVFTIGSLLSYLSNLSYLSRMAMIGMVIVLIVHLFGVRKFLLFVAKEEGIWFAIKAFFTGIALYVVILAGAAASILF